MRLLNGILLLSLVVVITTLYITRYSADAHHRALFALERKIERAEQEQHILQVEWTGLNNPIYLEDLAQQHLSLTPPTPEQLSSLHPAPKEEQGL